MNYCELTSSITLLALTIAPELTNDEIKLFVSMLNQLEDTLITISIARGAQLALTPDRKPAITTPAPTTTPATTTAPTKSEEK